MGAAARGRSASPFALLNGVPGSGRRSGARSHGSLPTSEIDVIHAHHYSPFVYGALATALGASSRACLHRARPALGRAAVGEAPLANQLLARVPQRVFAVSEDVKPTSSAKGFARRRSASSTTASSSARRLSAADRLRVRRELGVRRWRVRRRHGRAARPGQGSRNLASRRSRRCRARSGSSLSATVRSARRSRRRPRSSESAIGSCSSAIGTTRAPGSPAATCT